MAKHWSLPLLVNLLLGVPAVVPVFLLYYFATNWPLAELGLTSREPTENDGVAPMLLVLVPVLVLYGLVWWLANAPLRRRTALAPRTYWILSSLATLAPTAALIAPS
ncbi:hypothetical protein JNUCC64_17855 [Streptomyces sp. JNUCC 64]